MKTLAAYASSTRSGALFHAFFAVVAYALLGGSGCTSLQVPAAAAVYDFGPTALPADTRAPVRPMPAPALLLEPVQARAALDGTALQYRLAYANAQQLRPYAQARWSMAPAELLQQRLRSQLGAHRALLQDGQGLVVPPGSLRLYVELDEFSQVFDSPSHSHALLRAHATLAQLEASGYRLLAQRSFTLQRPAPTPDAAGGVQALGQASDALVSELLGWMDGAVAR